MKIKSLSFENYKAFSEKQTIQLKPITILIGKNSSGKSSIAKLFTLLENSLSGEINEPLLIKNNGVELGSEFRDLAFNRNSLPVSFDIELENEDKLEVKIAQVNLKYELTILEWSFNDFRLIYDPEQGYISNDGSSYKIKFKGFIPNEITGSDEEIPPFYADFRNFQMNLDYIGPFRYLPLRQFHLSGQIDFNKTGIKGENAYEILGISKIRETDLHEKVGQWYEEHFDGWKLIVENSKDINFDQSFKVLLQKVQTSLETEQIRHQNEITVNIVDVGQGMNQALPLVVRSNFGRKDSIIVLEQPELHLHPAAHADLAELFARSAKEHDQTFIIETHSENIILRLRKLIVENNFGYTKHDLVIYWIEESETEGQWIVEITVDELGTLSDWREGVFNEDLKEILAMKNAVRQKNS